MLQYLCCLDFTHCKLYILNAEEQDVAKENRRNIIFRLNKYERLIVYPVLISCLIVFFISVLCIMYSFFPKDFSITKDVQLGQLSVLIPISLIVVFLLSIFVIFQTYYMSNKIIGPFERIVKELDEVVEGKRKQPLETRKGNEMFDDLLKLINQLIKKSGI